MVFKSKQLAIHYFSKLYSAIADFIFEELGLECSMLKARKQLERRFFS
jgi:hypothetical protein